MECVRYVHHGRWSWREEWVVKGSRTVVREQMKFDGMLMIVQHDLKRMMVSHQDLRKYCPKDYKLIIKDFQDLEKDLLRHERPCDCDECPGPGAGEASVMPCKCEICLTDEICDVPSCICQDV